MDVALITKSPRGDKVIIECEKKKIRLVAYLQKYVEIGAILMRPKSRFNATKGSSFDKEAKFIWCKISIFMSKIG